MDEIKNKVYELEGLLELAGMRPEKEAELRPLIGKRIAEINKLWDDVSADEPTEPENTEAAASEAEVAGDVEAACETEVACEAVAECISESDGLTADGEDMETDFDEPLYQAPDDDPEELDDPEEPVETAEQEEQEERVELSKELSGDKKVPAFRLSINDRYRFARVFAGGDMKKLDEITAVVASLPDVQAVEEYVYGDLGADADDPEVEDFLELVALSKK